MTTPETVLITTTINNPVGLWQWAHSMAPGDWIIVTGDHKTPHDSVRDLLARIERELGIRTMYRSDTEQDHWAVSPFIGWNCIQRRNIALLEAMLLKPRYILTVDDDNAPKSSEQVRQLVRVMQGHNDTTRLVRSDTRWYNPGRQCVTGRLHHVVHRGYPLSQRHHKPFLTYDDPSALEVGVAAMLWTGDPDIDAMERIVNAPDVTRVNRETVILAPGTWAPFNTQATMFRAELAPFMFMLPHVGRYDDIWASYITRTAMDQMNWGTYYGHPVVHQDRNEHDLVSDLEAELFGMRHNEKFIEILRSIDWSDEKNSVSRRAMWYHIADNISQRATFLPIKTVAAMDAWQCDVTYALEEEW